jgi:carbon-monoxide dehydrogenase large subunit
MIVEGQVHGGIAQGVGQALLEGAATTPTASSDGELHGLPCRAPTTVLRCRHDRDAVPVNPLGIKGCGEAGAIGSPPAVINAITDALGHEDSHAGDAARCGAAQKSVNRMAAEHAGHPGQLRSSADPIHA